MSELKPCPFCGGEARIDTEYDMDGFGNFHKVECKSCGASSKAHFCSQGNECPQYYQEVRDDWQNRANDSQLTTITKQRDELGLHLGGLLTTLRVKQGLTKHEAGCVADGIERLLSTINEQKGSN